MDVLFRDKLRQKPIVLVKDGFDSGKLLLLFPENEYRITVFHPAADVLGEKFEVFVEYRLWGYGKSEWIVAFDSERHLQEYLCKSLQRGKE